MKRSDRLLPRSGLALFRASSGTFAIFTAIRRLGVGTSWANNALSYTRICRRVLRRCRAYLGKHSNQNLEKITVRFARLVHEDPQSRSDDPS